MSNGLLRVNGWRLAPTFPPHANHVDTDVVWHNRRTKFISVLCAATRYSPEFGVLRDGNYDREFGIITLAEFLSIAKNNSIGALIGIQVCLCPKCYV